MGLLKFDNLPVNTLVGADRATFDAITRGAEIDDEYRRKFALTRRLGRLLDPFYTINNNYYRQLPPLTDTEEPIFILGHWRSGTTFVHNVISCDDRFGYCTTYQTVFPHLMLRGAAFFKWCAAAFMPAQRPTDALELKVDLPQEEEFALSNMMPYSHYNFWTFPRRMAEYREKYLVFNDITEEERRVFKESLAKLIDISLRTQHKRQFLSKNPPHTGRICTLLEMYPGAKFVYLIRNPYTVFESTSSFFGNTLKTIQLQHIDPEQLTREILDNYRALYTKYEAEKHLIPEGNLIEVRFEDFEADPVGMAARIYERLGLDGFDRSRPAMERYTSSRKGFKKNKYRYDERTIRLVEENWADALRQWDYKL